MTRPLRGSAHVARRRLAVPAQPGADGWPSAVLTALAGFLAACSAVLARPHR